jgi:hypothetical protein
MKRKSVLAMISLSLVVLSAGKCDDAAATAEKGAKGGECYSSGTCDEGLVCIDDECAPSSSEVGSGDTNDNGGISLEDAIADSSEILCDRLVTCYGEENVDDDCEDVLEKEFTNIGCKNYDDAQTEPCLNCLEDDLDCTEVNDIVLGAPLGAYCGVCDLMCD